MFTGIVEELGTFRGIEHLEGDAARVTVAGPLATEDAFIGCSIAVDGVCLTVTAVTDGAFVADVMRETLNLTTIGSRTDGDPVNLERAMRADGRLGGHVVSGHVDGLGEIVDRTAAPHWEVVRISVPAALARQIAKKGSVTVDGVSLTVSAVIELGDEPRDGAHWFEVSLIPATLANTTLGARKIGEKVNIETDVLAKYVERLLAEGTS